MARYIVLFVVMTAFSVLGASAQDMMKMPANSGKVVVIVRHEVKEYASWRKGYDADEPNRKSAGFKVWGVYADANNPNIVSVIGEFPNAAAAEAFIKSPKLKGTMEHAGVVGMPEVRILSEKP